MHCSSGLLQWRGFHWSSALLVILGYLKYATLYFFASVHWGGVLWVIQSLSLWPIRLHISQFKNKAEIVSVVREDRNLFVPQTLSFETLNSGYGFVHTCVNFCSRVMLRRWPNSSGSRRTGRRSRDWNSQPCFVVRRPGAILHHCPADLTARYVLYNDCFQTIPALNSSLWLHSLLASS